MQAIANLRELFCTVQLLHGLKVRLLAAGGLLIVHTGDEGGTSEAAFDAEVANKEKDASASGTGWGWSILNYS